MALLKMFLIFALSVEVIISGPCPCPNGSSCDEQDACVCDPGYTEPLCIKNINECSPNPCQNGGSCTDGVDSFTCSCAAGYTGSTCQTVLPSTRMCQICAIKPVDLNLKVDNTLAFDTFIESSVSTKLCEDDKTTIKNTATSEMIIRASLQVLVPNPYHCYFSFKFGERISQVGCLVSGYNISGGHYTQGSCEAMGRLASGEVLSVVIDTAQGTYPCKLRGNSFLCLSAMEILKD